jgi:DNA (cytosine-5)-methyltransferase 1
VKRLQAVSLFSGCGGFDWGAAMAGVDIIWANDIDHAASVAYRSLFPEVEFVQGDVQGIKSFPKADVMIGCYPCTGFSIAARRRWKGREERNLDTIAGNFLYREFIRALKQVKPKYFFVENVGGMVSAKNGWFFQQQLDGFDDAGYEVQHKALEAASYGVPQTRRRIFIVGVKKDIAKEFRYQFLAPTHNVALKPPCPCMADVLHGLPEWPEGEFCTAPFHGHYLTRNRKRPWNTQSFTIVAHQGHVPLYPGGEPMRKTGKDSWILQGDLNRRLSWKECLFLQGLPPHLSMDVPLPCKYRVIGNAVPPAFGKALLTPVVEFEKGT